MFDGIAVGDFAVFIQIKQRLVKGLHAKFTRAFHHGLNFVDFPFTDVIANQLRIEQDFNRSAAAFAIRGGNQLLRYNGAKV